MIRQKEDKSEGNVTNFSVDVRHSNKDPSKTETFKCKTYLFLVKIKSLISLNAYFTLKAHFKAKYTKLHVRVDLSG